MRLSARLALYLLATARRPPAAAGRAPRAMEAADPPARPAGELVWIHAGASTTSAPVSALIERLRAERPQLSILCTRDTAEEEAPDRDDAITLVRPDDQPGAVDGFLTYWRPDLLLWIGTPLWPRLVRESRRRGVPAILADVSSSASGPFGLGPEHLVDAFDHVLARTMTDAEILRRASAAPRHVEASAALREGPAPPLCDQAELEALTRGKAGRPVWLAMGLPGDEVGPVSRAHQRAARLSHRLLLVAVPGCAADGPDLARAFGGLGWRTGLRSAGDDPTEDHEVYVADLEDEDSLWYRFAPITYLGGSLARIDCVRDPMIPAALGSAIVHGPANDAQKPALRRLGSAGAAWQVRDAEALGAAVADLLSPERAARMAHAAWHIASEGAEVTDRIIGLVVDRLDGVT